eukprot:PhM_4_TR352/c0_g1_i1/m.71475
MPTHAPIPFRTKWSAFRRTVEGPYRPRNMPRAADVKLPFYFKSFVRNAHLANLDTVETRGMYRDELNIERGKYTRLSKTWYIYTNGSMAEHDVEFTAPPFVVLYRDRLSVYAETQDAHMRAQRLRLRRAWENVVPKDQLPDPAPAPMCNILEFPYCVPSTQTPREALPLE